MYLTENMIVKNIKEVFGYDQPYFAKLLYLYLAEGYDRKKISLLKYLQMLYPFYESENRVHYNRKCF